MFNAVRKLALRSVGILLAASFYSFSADAQQDDEADATDPNILYLQEYAKREGVIVRPSGLQIRIIKRGDGDLPDPDSTVGVHYEGRLIDGSVFDSSYERGQPAKFPVTGVIRGWTEALILMQVGSVWEIVVPAEIGYGDDGAGDSIPPGATLIFKIELLSVL